jgi:hypothetical protein
LGTRSGKLLFPVSEEPHSKQEFREHAFPNGVWERGL